MRWIVLIAAVAALPFAQAQLDDPNESKDAPEDRIAWLKRLQRQAQGLSEATRELGNWNEHYDYILDATEKVFERYEWNSEADVFSMELVRDVGSIPPWQPERRFERAIEMVGDRYLLDEGQKATLQTQMFRMSLDLFSKHSDRIMEYSLEALKTRAAREPFTPEQIARWTTLAEPVMEDMRAEILAGAEEFMEHLDPEQRAIVERDIAAAERRMTDMQAMTEQWKRGEWQPADWGMEEDPIQNAAAAEGFEHPGPATTRPPTASPGGAAAVPGENPPRKLGPRINPVRNRDDHEPAAEEEGEAAGAEERPEDVERAPVRRESDARPSERDVRKQPEREARRGPAAPKAEEDEWARYVRQFIEKYKLNDEQQQRAWLYYRGAKDRARLFDQRHKRRLEQAQGRSADRKSGDTAAITELETAHQAEQDRLFAQLKQRLERLPTRAQRREAAAAQPTPPEQPKPAAKPKPERPTSQPTTKPK